MSDINKTDSRVLSFDVLRVIACIAVITIHIAAKTIRLVPIGSYEWMVFNVFDSLSRWGVPVFIMISGALFLAPEKQLDTRKLFTKNIPRIVISFVFWSGLYSLAEYIKGERLRTVAFDFIRGGTHLWFLYMIAGLYLMVPLLRRITASRRLTQYFLLLWLVFSVVMPTTKGFLLLFYDRISDWVDVVANNMSIKLVCGYTGYFMLGHWLHQNELPKKRRCIIYGLGIIGAGMIVVLTYLLSAKQKHLDQFFYDYLTAFVLCEAVAVFVFFKYHTKNQLKGAVRTLLLTASQYSFGIYLVHFFMVQSTETLNPLIAMPLWTAAIFIGSFAISFVLNKIPVVNRYLV